MPASGARGIDYGARRTAARTDRNRQETMMSRNAVKLVRVTDLTHRERSTVCDIPSMGPLLAGWWHDLGLSTATAGCVARKLISAARAGEWEDVHRLADYVSLDVSAVDASAAAVFNAGDYWAAGL